MLRIDVKGTTGKNVSEIIPNSKLKDLLEGDGERFDEIIEYKDIQLAVNKVPIMLKDEIAELSLNLQGRLLRVIQEKEIMRLGNGRVIPVDVRIISATNKDLPAMVENGDFRQDLYYRLDILNLHLPSLSQRREDIHLIVENFMRMYAPLSDFKDISITEQAKKMLQDFY